MLRLTTPQREMLLWAFKRRNSFKLADVIAGIHGGQPKRPDMIEKTLATLVRDGLATVVASGSENVYTLTEKARELAMNIVEAIKAKTKVAA